MTITADTPLVLDLRGLMCPHPVLRAKTALRSLPVGSVVVLECTDPLTMIDVPHFLRQTGHHLLGEERRDGLYVFIIRKHGPAPTHAAAS